MVASKSDECLSLRHSVASEQAEVDLLRAEIKTLKERLLISSSTRKEQSGVGLQATTLVHVVPPLTPKAGLSSHHTVPGYDSSSELSDIDEVIALTHRSELLDSCSDRSSSSEIELGHDAYNDLSSDSD